LENSLLNKYFPYFNLPKRFELERSIFFGLNLITLVAVFLIALFDFCTKSYTYLFMSLFVAIPLYVLCMAITIWHENTQFVINFQMVVAFGMVTFSYFSLGGFSGPFAMDLLNLFLVTATITRRKVRPIYLLLIGGYALGLIYIEIVHPTLIFNIRPNDPSLVQIMFLILRIIMSLSIAVNIMSEFELEQILLSKSLNEVQRKNHQMTNLYEEVRAQKDSLEELNGQLEKLVTIRTEQIINKNQQLLDYAFYNSHKVRGPLARVMGLVYLLRLQPQIDEKSAELVDRLANSTHELDDMIKQISRVLDEKKELVS